MHPHTLIGIDVGGTFTDAVAVRAGGVVASAKVPTEPEDLSGSLLGALDRVLEGVPPDEIARVSLSTTLITNLIAQARVPEVATLLVPGPGRDPVQRDQPRERTDELALDRADPARLHLPAVEVGAVVGEGDPQDGGFGRRGPRMRGFVGHAVNLVGSYPFVEHQRRGGGHVERIGAP